MDFRTSAGCSNCRTILGTVSIERDDVGASVALEVKRCADLTCEKLLCTACDQFQCDACGQTFCVDHLVSVLDGTDRPLRLCVECDAESKPLCPACGEHADLRPMENVTEKWYECCRCHARMDEAEIDAAQPPEPAPTCMECYEGVGDQWNGKPG